MNPMDTDDLAAQLDQRAATIAPHRPSSTTITSRARQAAGRRHRMFAGAVVAISLTSVVGGIAVAGAVRDRNAPLTALSSSTTAPLPPLHMGLGASDEILFAMDLSQFRTPATRGPDAVALGPDGSAPLAADPDGSSPPAVSPAGTAPPVAPPVVVVPPGSVPELGPPGVALSPLDDLLGGGYPQSEITYQLPDETRATITVSSDGGGQRYQDDLAGAKATPTADRFTIQAQGTTALVHKTPRPGVTDIMVDVSWIEPGGHLVTVDANSSHSSATTDPGSLAARARVLSDAEYRSIIDQYGH